MPSPVPLRLPARAPVVWRDPTTVQVGVESPSLVLTDVSRLDEAVLGAVAAGRADGGWRAVAAQLGRDPDEVAASVERLAPALVPPVGPRIGPPAVVRLAGDGPLADEIGHLLESEGLGVVLVDGRSCSGPADDARSASSFSSLPGVGLVVGGLAHDPAASTEWLRHDVVHLLVRVGDRSVRLGPTVVPGVTACSRCLHLTAGAVDPAWPAIAAQLVTAPTPPTSLLVRREVATRATRRLLDVVGWAAAGGPSPADVARCAEVVRVDHDTGEVTTSRARPRPDCGCAAPPGSGSDDAPRRGPARRPPTRAAAARARG